MDFVFASPIHYPFGGFILGKHQEKHAYQNEIYLNVVIIKEEQQEDLFGNIKHKGE